MSLAEETQRPATKPLPPPEPPRRPLRRAVVLIVLLAVVVAGAAIAYRWWLDARQYEWTDDAFIDGDIIPISPQVAAKTNSVLVSDNQPVKKGDVLVLLDPTDYQVVLDQKKATESSMRGKVEQARTQEAVARANVGEADAELNVAKTNALNMQQELDRMQGLDPRARAQEKMDDTIANQRSSSATVEQAEAKVKAAEAQVLEEAAAVLTAQSDALKAAADTRAAQIQVDYCTIAAPCDGVITHKNIEPGMYVTVGQPLFSIVPTNVWVTANFKETQLELMRPGQKVFIYVDAYPEKTFQGHLQSVQHGTGSTFSLLPPENATGNFVKVVQRVPVKIEFDSGETGDADHPLSPGMSVEPRVLVKPNQD
jgi:membrane fusion protein, multidrug efflux system